MLGWLLVIGGILFYLSFAHFVSYELEKNRIVKKRKWDLNICCGKTDGGGVNADIFQHKEVPNFVLVKDVYNLPFKDKQFKTVLCSHTIEHVDDPHAFFNELQRVAEQVTIVIPPLYDMCAVLNYLEHRTVFLTFKKEHHSLPTNIRLRGARTIQAVVGQVNHA